MLINILSVFIGGGIGSTLRYLISEFSQRSFGTSMWGTSMINIVGCFAMGWMFQLLSTRVNIFPTHILVAISVGLIGGFTTFSALNIEVMELIRSGKILYGASYLILSMILGLVCTILGYYIKSKI